MMEESSNSSLGGSCFSCPRCRSRFCYFIAIIIIIFTGLLWRSGRIPLPVFWSKYGGDALWSVVVFCGFGFLWQRATTWRIALVALGFSFAIEFSQLYHAPWIDSLRETRPGALILGSVFNWPDLVAYTVGVFLGTLLEVFLLSPAACRK